MNVLCIGNSFSQDATRYLHQIAEAAGEEMKVVNLYIGGCPLRRHYNNILEDAKAYAMEFNGVNTGFFVSIKEALLSDEWDAVTMQQVSSQSVQYSTYQPYLTALAAYVKKCAPKARQLLHQTWAYEQGSQRLCMEMGYKTRQEMYQDLADAYRQAAEDISADGIIPSGYAFECAAYNGLERLHRDTFHASLGAGRALLGFLWYGFLTGKDVDAVEFHGFDEPVGDADLALVKKSAKQALEDYC